MNTGWKSPTATGAKENDWTNPTNTYSSNNAYATATDDEDRKQSYESFGFNIPEGAVIKGIKVSLEAKIDAPGENGLYGSIYHHGDVGFTASKHTGALTDSDAVYVLGGSDDLWGKEWTPVSFSNDNFSVKIELDTLLSGKTWSLDHIQVKVYYEDWTVASSPGTMADDATVGTVAWTDENNAKTDDENFATAGPLSGETFPEGIENSIKIVKGGTIIGDEKSTGATLPSPADYISYGGSADLWGESWTATDINSSNFGIVFSGKSDNPADSTSHYLKATNFGFTIPSGAIINGILAEIKCRYAYTGIGILQINVFYIKIAIYYTTVGPFPTFIR